MTVLTLLGSLQGTTGLLSHSGAQVDVLCRHGAATLLVASSRCCCCGHFVAHADFVPPRRIGGRYGRPSIFIRVTTREGAVITLPGIYLDDLGDADGVEVAGDLRAAVLRQLALLGGEELAKKVALYSPGDGESEEKEVKGVVVSVNPNEKTCSKTDDSDEDTDDSGDSDDDAVLERFQRLKVAKGLIDALQKAAGGSPASSVAT